MMERLRFSFADLHPDATGLFGDLDWLLRFVAGSFEVWVDGELLFDEPEFPVLELARVLKEWLARDFTEGRALDYEVSGGAPGTLTIRQDAGRWQIDSVHRPAEKPLPPRLTDDDLRSGVRSFIDDLARQTQREYDYDVNGLLRRVQAGPSR
jgi:hypothetical protein